MDYILTATSTCINPVNAQFQSCRLLQTTYQFIVPSSSTTTIDLTNTNTILYVIGALILGVIIFIIGREIYNLFRF
jgi:hypothetical protein